MCWHRMRRESRRLYGAPRAAAEAWLRAQGWRERRDSESAWRWFDKRFPASHWRLEDALELMRYDPDRSKYEAADRNSSGLSRNQRKP